MARQPSHKLDREKGAITNLAGEVTHVRRTRDGEQFYVAPSTETPSASRSRTRRRGSA